MCRPHATMPPSEASAPGSTGNRNPLLAGRRVSASTIATRALAPPSSFPAATPSPSRLAPTLRPSASRRGSEARRGAGARAWAARDSRPGRPAIASASCQCVVFSRSIYYQKPTIGRRPAQTAWHDSKNHSLPDIFTAAKKTAQEKHSSVLCAGSWCPSGAGLLAARGMIDETPRRMPPAQVASARLGRSSTRAGASAAAWARVPSRRSTRPPICTRSAAPMVGTRTWPSGVVRIQVREKAVAEADPPPSLWS